MADGCGRGDRLHVAVGGVLALFRQPPARAAARHRRRRDGHGADPGDDPRRARRRTRRDRACGIARARARGRPGAAGDARPDGAERTDRADAVRAWRVHSRGYRGDRASPDLADACAAGACAGEGAVTGILRARGHVDAVVRDAEGHRGDDRGRIPARPSLWRERNCRRHRARRMEQCAGPDPQGRRDLRLFHRHRCAPPAATHPCRGTCDGRLGTCLLYTSRCV